jgi:hypothetical protein
MSKRERSHGKTESQKDSRARLPLFFFFYYSYVHTRLGSARLPLFVTTHPLEN